MEFKFTCGIYFFTQAFNDNDNVKKSDIGDSVSASAPVVAKQAPLAPSNPNNYVVRGSSLSLFLRIRKGL